MMNNATIYSRSSSNETKPRSCHPSEELSDVKKAITSLTKIHQNYVDMKKVLVKTPSPSFNLVSTTFLDEASDLLSSISVKQQSSIAAQSTTCCSNEGSAGAGMIK